MNPTIDLVRGELERLFTLDEMTKMSERLLGLAADDVGGASAKGSFARALTERCLDGDRLHALIDVMAHARKDLDPRVRDLGGVFGDEELLEGQIVSDFTVERKIGESELGIVYQAVRQDGDARVDYAVKVLRREAARDRRAVHRFLTANRLVGTVSHPGLPRTVEAGELEPGVFYVAYPFVPGGTLAARLARTGPASYAELRPLLQGILAALAALHSAHLVHGDLKTENILVTPAEAEGAAETVTLIDFGTDRLRSRTLAANGHTGLLAVVGSPKTVAPELVRGRPASPASDVYAFGAVVYELLTGKPIFHDQPSATDAAFAHLTAAPEAPSHRAPPGWVPKDVDALVLACLQKDPAKRPHDAAQLLEMLTSAGRSSMSMLLGSGFPADELKKREEALLANPTELEAALNLENAVEQGADPIRVGEAFAAASALVRSPTPEGIEAKKALLYRAARIFDSAGRDKVRAEQVFASIVNIDPEDEIALVALEDTRKALGKYEELVEMLLARTQAAPQGAPRGRALAEIGRLYANELDDPDQAVVAFTRALCEHPTNEEYAAEVDRLAGTRQQLWHDQLAIVAEALNAGRLAHHDQIALIVRAARWYDKKLGRADMALAAYKQVVMMDPAHEAAAEGMTEIYRRAQQWPELVSVLVGRADASASAPRARDLRAEAADLLETRLGDTKHARELLERVLADDPGHARATEAMARIAERSGDFAAVASVLSARAAVSRGSDKAALLAKIAEIHEDHLGDLAEATRRFEAALAIDPGNLQAMKGLDRIWSRSGKFRELVALLERQIEAAATPRQKIGLYERVAALHDEEFLNHEAAAVALEKLLALDATHDGALTALARHYRALQRWEDLAGLLEKHALVTSDEARRTELLLARARTLSEQIGSPERATKTYEEILARSPQHAGALEALAQLRELTGDALAALHAIEALAVKAPTPEAKSEQWTRAARLLESRGDKDGAIERYKLALEANPKDLAASVTLRRAYASRGNWAAVVALLERELFVAEGATAKSIVCAELAHVQLVHMNDVPKADGAARHALELDPGSVLAVVVLGDLAFDAKRFAEAAGYYERVLGRVATLGEVEAVRVVVRFMDAFNRAEGREITPPVEASDGSWIGGAVSQSRIAAAASAEAPSTTVPPPQATHPRMLAAIEALLAIAPKDVRTVAHAANALFAFGDPKSAFRMHEELLKNHGDNLAGSDRAEALHNLGESARRSGDLETAIAPLREAIDLDPSNPEAYRALAKVFDQLGDWKESVTVRRLRLQLASGDERFELLLEIGDILFGKVGDRAGASKAYGEALQERPDDKKLLTKLMPFYSEEKDWVKVCEVVLKLADFADDAKQKSKYMHTAATIASQHLKDVEMALDFYTRALAFDVSNDRALAEALDLFAQRGRHDEVEKLLKSQLDQAKVAQDREKIVKILDSLGGLYAKHLKDADLAIEAYEAAHAFDADDRPRAEKLAELYGQDTKQYFAKAVGMQFALLRRNPYRVESYKQLSRLYGEAQQVDASYCVSQALAALRLATPDEERFYLKHRSENAAPAQSSLDEEAWSRVMHWDLDPLLTRVFALVQPTVLRTRTKTLEQIGYDLRYAVDIARHAHPISQTLYYAQGVLGVAPPLVFENPNDPGVLGMVHARTPAVLLGAKAFANDLGNQGLAFVAGRHLTSFRPGFYIRHLVPTGTGLKAWLFAAIRLCVPQFPVSPDIAAPVTEASAYLAQDFGGPERDELASLVSKLLQNGGALDLKKWVAAIDATSDRVGLLLAHDLQAATEQIRVSEASSSVPVKERMKDIVLFSVSEEYFALRRKLGIAVQA